MKLSAPKQSTYVISLIIAIVAVVARYLVDIPNITFNVAFILLIVAFVILALANYMKGL